MKKIAIASIIALAATTASAWEVGVTAARDYSGNDRNAFGLHLGQKYGVVGVGAEIDRAYSGENDQNRYSLVGTVDVTKVGPVTVFVKGAGSYLDNQTGSDGYAVALGGGVSVPVMSKVAATLDVTRQYGQARVSQFDGNRVSLGLRYSF